MPKRKWTTSAVVDGSPAMPPPPPNITPLSNSTSRRSSARRGAQTVTNPDKTDAVTDANEALRASPDNAVNKDLKPALTNGEKHKHTTDSEPLAEEPPPPKKAKRGAKAASKAKDGAPAEKVKSEEVVEVVAGAHTERAAPKAKKSADADGDGVMGDPEADDADVAADPEEIKKAMSRPPPVNSSYLPLPWKGRLGYACLCTYLRYSNPPVFCSRTTRIASILEHRHPLADPSQPEHPTKNRPDKNKPADPRLGQKFVEDLALANVRDMAKMLRWNDKYGIKFMRLSSESFPFASHPDYGYDIASFASEALADVGKVVAELGHRVTVHPGQFTQLGSPRPSVIENAVRDLEWHDKMLTLMKLPEQQDRDAVMILHMGGIFEGKAETLARFKENYQKLLSDSVKKRLVLENDDMGWSVHDLLPTCQELNIPLVLDFHHHNIVFDSSKVREGTEDVQTLYPVIRETWTRKGITQKMHYSEPEPGAVTPRQRRKHNPRVMTLPPCPPDMDLMIEAKDKEQAVFELMKTFKLPGHEKIADIVPYLRADSNNTHTAGGKPKATPKKKSAKAEEEEESVANGEPIKIIPEEEIGMGGPQGRVYWPPGMEEWLRPKKREVKKKADPATMTPKEKAKATIEGAKARAAGKGGKKAVKQAKASPPVESDDGEEAADYEAKDAAIEEAPMKKEEDVESKPVAAPTKRRGRAAAQAPDKGSANGVNGAVPSRPNRRGKKAANYKEDEADDE